ncbi:MAG: putative signal peptide protein [Bacteroidota bacterium]
MIIKRFQTLYLLAVIAFICGSSRELCAQQPYFNEWLTPGSEYIRLLVPKDGLYRVRASDLQAAGFQNVAAIIPANLQVFYRGVEIPIFVKDSNSGAFEFLEFYGRRNDGALDSLLYRSSDPPFANNPDLQPNRFTSFFTDTSAYFLTWNNLGTRRLQDISPQNFDDHVPEPWYRYLVLQEYQESFFVGGGGADDYWNVLNPDWVTGEGVIGGAFRTGDSPDVMSRRLKTPGFANSGNPVHVEGRVVGANNTAQHITAMDFDLFEVFRDTTANINVHTFEFDLQISLGPETPIRFRAYGQTTPQDNQRACWATLDYDRNFNLNGDSATIVREWMETDTAYFRFLNAEVNSEAWLIDESNGLRIAANVQGDTLHFLVPGAATMRELYLVTDVGLQSAEIDPEGVEPLISTDTVGGDFVIITHRKFQNSAEAYANYRDTCTTNPFLQSKIVYIDQILDEFGYGSVTPWAIKNFCRYAMEQWTIKPKHFLIWGKGRNMGKLDNRENYIPVFGTPANDLEYVTNFSRDVVDLVPKAGLGRVSLREDQHGFDYLAKVNEYEHLLPEPWTKNALFMGGGADQGQQSAISFYLNDSVDGYRPFWENAPLNGKVWSFQKRNNSFEFTNGMTTEERINAGASLLQFYGHSSVSVFELDILEPNLYKNDGKYPFMAAFGCSGGNYYNEGASYGERFILQPGKGGIGFLGNTTSGLLTLLGQYGQAFYPVALRDSFGKSMGVILTETIRRFSQAVFSDNSVHGANHCKQMNLQGDPAIALNLPRKCDIRIGAEDIYFPDGFPAALDQSFRLNVILHNDGRSFADSFSVVITQQLPNSGPIVHSDTLQHPHFGSLDTLELIIPNLSGFAAAGYNKFTVQVDPLDSLDELVEQTNNYAEVEQLFIGNIAKPLEPTGFAIVPHATVALIASTYQMVATGPIRYSFEIDTVHTFDSPFKRSSPVVLGNSSMAEWPIPFAMSPGQVYYWRSRLTDTYPEQWTVSSMKYVPDKSGWSQGKEPQMMGNATQGIQLGEISRDWEFDRWTTELHAYILSYGFPGKAVYFMGNYASSDDAPNGVLFTPIDSKTLIPRILDTSKGDWRFLSAPNPSNPNSLNDLPVTIASLVPGDYFLLVTSGNPSVPNWPDEVLHSLEMVGGSFSVLRPMVNGDRLIFFGQKGGAPGSAIMITKPNLESEGLPPLHDLRKDLSGIRSVGEIQSTTIGPANSWAEFTFDWASIDPFVGDSLDVSVYGIRRDGSEALLFANETVTAISIAGVNADSFPTLRLEAKVQDHVHYTPPQLDQWEVYFDPVADLAIDANRGVFVPDTVDEGQIIPVSFFVRNLTSQTMDSVRVKYTLQAANRSLIEVGTKRYSGFEAREIRRMEYAIPTSGIGLEAGRYTLIIEVNPESEVPENQHFNNFYYEPLWVRTDGLGPMVDVTIDGKHLMGGDIVSPEPTIVIQINDENAYLPVAVSDSTYRIWFGVERSFRSNPMVTIENNDSIEVVPVRMPENKSRLIFKPGRLADGEYTLAVQGYDAKGNEAARKPYVIQMNVVNQKAISEVLPYPNPFSSACHFVYTLTGDEKPSRFDVEIYTITGKLVKVVDLLAMGEVHFGYNVTQYAWDGHDEFGDQLANGVYLYRVRTKFDNQASVELRDEGISGYFKNGFGKMYLMR